ncbi:MAG: hypothetical protein LBG71_01405 [Clostridiales Family XIII bacterium]|jgi:hypothetical protein|nr:hypothetical protein [Clostridiales Family XIII bacterium]
MRIDFLSESFSLSRMALKKLWQGGERAGLGGTPVAGEALGTALRTDGFAEALTDQKRRFMLGLYENSQENTAKVSFNGCADDNPYTNAIRLASGLGGQPEKLYTGSFFSHDPARGECLPRRDNTVFARVNPLFSLRNP